MVVIVIMVVIVMIMASVVASNMSVHVTTLQ
jgi:hypothetical protein